MLIIQKTYRLWKKPINSAKIIQHAVIKWLYRPGGLFMKQAKDRYYCVAMGLISGEMALRACLYQYLYLLCYNVVCDREFSIVEQ